jgi:hypothetical protein
MDSGHDQKKRPARRKGLWPQLALTGCLLFPADAARAATVLPLDHLPGHSRTDPAAPVARIPTGGALQMPHQPERREARERSTAGERRQSVVDHRSDELASSLAGALLLVGVGGLIGGAAFWAASPSASRAANA